MNMSRDARKVVFRCLNCGGYEEAISWLWIPATSEGVFVKSIRWQCPDCAKSGSGQQEFVDTGRRVIAGFEIFAPECLN